MNTMKKILVTTALITISSLANANSEKMCEVLAGACGKHGGLTCEIYVKACGSSSQRASLEQGA